MKIDKDFKKMIEALQAKGTTIVGADTCMCAECVARRKTGDIKPLDIISGKLPKNATAKERQEHFEKMVRLQAGMLGKDSLKEE